MRFMKIKYSKILVNIHDFFEKPDNVWAYLAQAIIFLFVFVSIGITGIEFLRPDIYQKYELDFQIANHIILAVFTVEYVLRLVSSSKKLEFIRKPMNVVDFLSIAPNYIELLLPLFVNTEELRALRIIRLLRLTRLIRAFKIFEYSRFIKKVFVLQDTILESIFPVLLIFAGIKALIWLLEARNLWFSTPDLSNLFGTMGFALGIILSQKIGVSYDKFLNIEETILRIYGNLRTLSLILDKKKPGFGKKIISEWVSAFLFLLENPKSQNHLLHPADEKLYSEVAKIERQPAELAILCGEIATDAAMCLSKKVRITPKAYDVLLHQATIVYLLLMVMFIPGIVGVGSVVIATYLLYGMYELTEDLDSILGGSHNLININMVEIRSLRQK